MAGNATTAPVVAFTQPTPRAGMLVMNWNRPPRTSLDPSGVSSRASTCAGCTEAKNEVSAPVVALTAATRGLRTPALPGMVTVSKLPPA